MQLFLPEKKSLLKFLTCFIFLTSCGFDEEAVVNSSEFYNNSIKVVKNLFETDIVFEKNGFDAEHDFFFEMVIIGEGIETNILYSARLAELDSIKLELPVGYKKFLLTIQDEKNIEIYQKVFEHLIEPDKTNRLKFDLNIPDSNQYSSVIIDSAIKFNKPPVIEKIEKKKYCKCGKQELQLSGIVEDPESDELGFLWTSKSEDGSYATFSNPFSIETKIKFPENSMGRFTLTLTVFDKTGNQNSKSVCIIRN